MKKECIFENFRNSFESSFPFVLIIYSQGQDLWWGRESFNKELLFIAKKKFFDGSEKRDKVRFIGTLTAPMMIKTSHKQYRKQMIFAKDIRNVVYLLDRLMEFLLQGGYCRSFKMRNLKNALKL